MLDEMLSSLRGARDVSGPFQEVEKWGESWLLSLCAAIEGDPEIADWVQSSLYDHVENCLCRRPGLEPAEAVVMLSQRERTHSLRPPRNQTGRIRRLAHALAEHQSPEVLTQILMEQKTEELGHCLAQEMVLLDTPVPTGYGGPPQGHPLALLPLKKTPVEIQEPKQQTLEPPSWEGQFELFRPKTETQEAVNGWLELSSGRVEVEGFLFKDPVETPPLLALPLECVRGALGLRELNVRAAFDLLFQAAAEGGAFGGARFGAYGRLAAFRSLGAALESEANYASICADSLEARFFGFRSDSAWFEGAGWDLGLAILRPGGHELVVLAATDAS